MIMPLHKPASVDEDGAQAIALTALTHVLADVELTERFLGITGIDGADLPVHIREEAFLGGVLDFVMGDEALVIDVCRDAGFAPEIIAKARQRLPGGALMR